MVSLAQNSLASISHTFMRFFILIDLINWISLFSVNFDLIAHNLSRSTYKLGTHNSICWILVSVRCPIHSNAFQQMGFFENSCDKILIGFCMFLLILSIKWIFGPCEHQIWRLGAKFALLLLLIGCLFVCSKTCLNMAISRIKLLQNKRDMQLKHMRKEIAQFLQAGQEAIARIRVQVSKFYRKNAYSCVTSFCVWIVIDNFDPFHNLVGGACYPRAKHMGCIWDIGAFLWICPCKSSHYWKPEVSAWTLVVVIAWVYLNSDISGFSCHLWTWPLGVLC